MGITELRIDHAGKEATKGQRGSSAKNDDVDVVSQLKVDTHGVTLSVDRQRISWVPQNVEMKRDGACHSLRNRWTVSDAVTACIRDLDTGSVRHLTSLCAEPRHSSNNTSCQVEAPTPD
jgi:hypothetical protein